MSIKNKPEDMTPGEYAMSIAVSESYAAVPDVEWADYPTLVDGYPADEDPSAAALEDAIRDSEAARAEFVQERVAELLATWAEDVA